MPIRQRKLPDWFHDDDDYIGNQYKKNVKKLEEDHQYPLVVTQGRVLMHMLKLLLVSKGIGVRTSTQGKKHYLE